MWRLSRARDKWHTYASFLVAAGVPLPEVQAALGHASITTTMLYTNLSPDYLERIRVALAESSGQRLRCLRVLK